MPWSLLNKIKHDELIITTNRLGYMLYLTNSDLTDKNVQEGQYIKSEKFKKILIMPDKISITKQRVTIYLI